VNRLPRITPALLIGLGVAYLVLTRLLLAWNGVIGDGARDLAVALRILRAEEFPLRGPLFGNTFHLGPIYYYFVALPLGLFQTATAVMSFLALVTLLAVYFGYRVGTLLFDRRTGLVFACLLGGDFIAAIAALQLSNISLILPISLALIHTTLLAVVHRRPGYLVVAMSIAAIALQIHPATVTLFPFFAVGICLPTERGRAKALAIGTAIALILFAPILADELTRQGNTVHQIFGSVKQPVRIGEGPPLAALPKTFWWGLFLSPGAARRMSEGVTPSWLRHLALLMAYAVSLTALAGLALTFADLFQRERRRSSALILCWLFPWWLIVPRFVIPLTWWYLYPIHPGFLLLAARTLVWISDRAPQAWRRRGILAYAFSLVAFVLPAWLATAAIQRSANEGLLRIPSPLVWRPDASGPQLPEFVYPSIGVREEERLTKSLLQESGCDPSLLKRLRGFSLWLALQSRGLLLQLHQPRCRGKGDPGHTGSFLVMRASDLPPAFRRPTEPFRPLVILRQPAPGLLTNVRYSPTFQRRWESRVFNDSAWESLTIPALRTPDPTAYPAPPDMTWPRTPIFVRARLRSSGTGSVFLGIAFPSAAPWIHQGHVNAVFVNGEPSPPPHVRTPYLQLYDLGSLLAPGNNLIALAIGGPPTFTLDLFALPEEP